MRIQLSGGTGSPSSGCAGKLFGSIFGLIFLLAGLGFTFLIGREAWKVLETWTSWQEAPSKIISSEARTDGDEESPYSFVVAYDYSFQGGHFTGKVFRSSYSGSADFRPVQRLLITYPRGSRHECWVDPMHPERSVLKRQSPFFFFLIFFPLIFVAIGATVLVVTWRKASRTRAGVPELGKRGMDPRFKRRLLMGVFLLMFLGGVGGVYAMREWIMGPLVAQSWKHVSARVLESHLRRHESTDSDGHTSVTWKIDILYQYEINAQAFRSNRYGFVGGSSSGRESKKEIVDRYPPGRTIEVRVNPKDPSSAVIRAGWSLGHLLVLIPGVILLIGLFGLFRVGRSTPAPPGTGLSVEETREEMEEAPLVLKPGKGRALKSVGLLILTLFWNGIISIFVFEVIAAFRRGHPDWVQTVFMIPFVLVGIGLVLFFLHSLLALWNPRTTLHLERAPLHLGEEVNLRWEIRGALSRLKDFRLALVGTERATYRRGTTTHTDTEVFARIPIVENRASSMSPQGTAVLRIPDSTMHSFKASNNQIVWNLEIKADVPRWPDVSDSWEITILPLPREKEGSWTS